MLEDYDEAFESFSAPEKRQAILRRRNNDINTQFLGERPRCVEAYSMERYYGKLLAWTIKCLTTRPGWEIVSNHGYLESKPIFRDVQTGCTTFESCLIDGQMLIEVERIRIVITVFSRGGYSQIEAGREHEDLVKKLIKDISSFLKENNFYRGAKIYFDGEIYFLNAGQRDWDSVILDPASKKEIHLNTIGFLKNCGRLAKYSVSPKRGIILAGDPGTGKTVICKALMSEAKGITCITTVAYSLVTEGYICNLFSIAQDLSPSMVFIEDLDCIGQERHDFNRGLPPLIALLAEMDGISEKTAIVTVATSNSYETLDKALSERPARFDRVFKIARPNSQQRAELVKRISENTLVSENVMEYIVKLTNGFTPAQIQEVIFSMILDQIDEEVETIQFSKNDVDSAIHWINIKKTDPIGFNATAQLSALTNFEQNYRKE